MRHLARGSTGRRRSTGLALAFVAGALLTVSACGDEAGESTPAPTTPGPSHAQTLCAGLDLGNVVDTAACPRVQGQGLAPRYADAVTLCRRMAIDLNGRVPSWSEVQSVCVGATPAAMADYFMARPEYLRVAQRRWADAFGYNDAITWYRYIQRLDDLVAAVYRGEVAYDDFATEALVAPAYTGRFFGESRVARAFQVFLGRDAHAVEREDLVRLWNIWSIIYQDDPDYYFQYFQVVAATPTCGPPLDELLCHSDLYGPREVSLPVPNPDDGEDPANFLDVDSLTAEQWDILRAPGDVIVGLPAFWETAAAEALNRYLGWDAARAMPEVVQALADWLVDDAGGSLRALEREIVLSAPYLAPPEPPTDELDPATDAAPRWRFRAPRVMDVEVWLDSVQQFAGAGLGWCDHRYPVVQRGVAPDGTVVYTPNDYPAMGPDNPEPNPAYTQVARLLGGCPDRFTTFRFTGTGAVHALVQEQFIQLMCYQPQSSGLTPGGAFGAPFVPTDQAADLERLFVHQVRGVLGREPSDSEIAAFVADTEGCDAAGTCAPAQLPSQLCEALVKTAEFYHY